MKIRNVLSLFDGISCGQVALGRAGIEFDAYYASELDKYPIKITQANYPDTVQLGDVTKWREWDIDWSSIDLLIGGSPCQGFSFAGKQLAFDDPRSKLFFVYVDILNHIREFNPGVKFLLENVKMKKEFLAVISEHLGVEPVFINSSLVSAQNRQRYYWANWEFGLPEDKGILLKDILEDFGSGVIKSYGEWKPKKDKSQCLDANYHKGADNHGQRTIIKKLSDNHRVKGVTENDRGIRPHRGDARKTGISELGRLLKPESKTDSITTSHAPKVIVREKSKCVRSSGRGSYDRHEWDSISDCHYRKLTPIECERLQTLPDNFSLKSLNTRYQHDIMVGNKCNEVKFWKSVDSKNVISQSHLGKLNSAISTILDGLETEQQKQLGVKSIKIKIVSTKNAEGSGKRLKAYVSSTTKNGKESSQSTNQLSVKYAINLSEADRKGIARGITATYLNTETRYTEKKESYSLTEMKEEDTLKQKMVDGYIELLLNRLSEEPCEKERLFITLTAINTIIAKAIFMSASQTPITLRFTGSLNQSQGSLLEMDLSFLKMESIGETSDSARYKALGNGWTVEVIAHIFKGLKNGN